MSSILTAIFSIFSQLPGALGDYFKRKQDLEKIKLETQLKIEVEKQKLAARVAEAEQERARVIISATSPTFKYFTFIMWFGPFMIGLVAPELSARIFDNLGKMPEWYVQSCMIIMFTVWGISVSGPVVGAVFNGLGDFFAARRQFKLDRINRQAVFEALRAINGGKLSSQDVKIGDDIINILDKGKQEDGK